MTCAYQDGRARVASIDYFRVVWNMLVFVSHPLTFSSSWICSSWLVQSLRILYRLLGRWYYSSSHPSLCLQHPVNFAYQLVISSIWSYQHRCCPMTLHYRCVLSWISVDCYPYLGKIHNHSPTMAFDLSPLWCCYSIGACWEPRRHFTSLNSRWIACPMGWWFSHSAAYLLCCSDDG